MHVFRHRSSRQKYFAQDFLSSALFSSIGYRQVNHLIAYFTAMTDELFFLSDSDDEQAFRTAWLIAGFLQDRLTEAEHDELDDWVTASKENQRLFEDCINPVNREKWTEWEKKLPVKEALAKMKSRAGFKEKVGPGRLVRFWRYPLAASLLIASAAGIWWWQMNKKVNSAVGSHIATTAEDWAPGKDQAVLILGDGKREGLDSAGSGTLAYQGGSIVIKADSGQLIYQPSQEGHTEAVAFNTLKVPRGGQYRLTLPDGTQVWVNADSRIKYPTAFLGADRTVELSGEAYFAVAKDPHRPFTVKLGKTAVQVLGTEFNVHAYADEKRQDITLASGSIIVLPDSASGRGKRLLQPGEQARIGPEGQTAVVKANLEAALAWKNGWFIFRDQSLDEILPQLARWYGVDIDNQVVTSQHFNASIPRSVSLSKVLHLLEQTRHVHFVIDAGRITVKE
jgi:transmembrane sensor